MSSSIDEIKERLDIVQVISEYLQLKKVGANYRALCPFHSEKTPSFYVSPSRQIFKCFGCGASGSIFDFIMRIEGVEFPESLQILAKKAGVEIKKEPIEKRTERQRQYEICELAAKFFERQLEGTKIGKEAKEYLIGRAISEDSIGEWRVGYAPDTWEGLSDFLVGRGYKREEILKAGLTVQRENIREIRTQISENSRDSYDRFRGRIMFPIFDLNSQAIGFTGRVFKKDKEQAKYVNTPNTLLYDKSRVLYGLDKAKMKIREKDACILVEGQTDVILSHQAGVCNVVAASGTALTSTQLRIISRYTKNLFLSLDMDVAGETATKRGIDIAQFQGFNIKIVPLPQGKDPADVVQDDPQKWKEIIKGAEEITNFYFEQSFNRFSKKTVDGKKKISQILLPFISRIQNKIEQAHWVGELARRFSVKEEIIWEEMQKVANLPNILPGKAKQSPEDLQKTKSQQRQTEERLLLLILKFPQYLKELKRLPKFSFKQGEKLFEAIRQRRTPPKELAQLVSELELQFDVEKDQQEIEPEEEIRFCVSQLQKMSRDEKVEKIIEELKEAEASHNKARCSQLLEKLNKL